MKEFQISTRHKLACVPWREDVANMFPTAPQVEIPLRPGGDPVRLICVPHLPAESFILQRLGIPVPAPVLSHYAWPHPPGQPPFQAQRHTTALLTMNQRAYVLNGLGTGKTRALLWAWDYLRGSGLAKKLLVIAPLSTLKFVWAREVFALFGERVKCVVLHGTREQRLARLADPDAQVFAINHDGLKVVLDEIMLRDDIDTLAIDELAVYRNGQTARHKQLKKLAMRMNWAWGATGAPTPTSPTDTWAQAVLLTPNTVPRYFTRWRDHLMLKVGQFQWVAKQNAVELAFQALQPSVRYTLEDVTELPPKITRTVDVELGAKQRKVYKELADRCYAAVQTHEITAANAGACMSKLLQVSAGWVYARDPATGERRAVSLDNDNRIATLIDAVTASDRKVLVFVPFKHALAGIGAAFTKEGIEHALVSGDTPANERANIFTLFQTTSKYHAIAAHPECLAHGVTLTAADTVIWFSPTTSLEIYDQANARISRVGQKHRQLVLHLQSTPVEKRIYALLQRNHRIQEKLLDLFAEATLTSGGNP